MVISALQERARQVSGIGQVKQGKRGKKNKRRGGSSVCICSTETAADGGGSQASRQIQAACTTAGQEAGYPFRKEFVGYRKVYAIV